MLLLRSYCPLSLLKKPVAQVYTEVPGIHKNVTVVTPVPDHRIFKAEQTITEETEIRRQTLEQGHQISTREHLIRTSGSPIQA